MPGTGKIQAASNAETYLLDVSRTLRRGTITGIDRVERAYIKRLLQPGCRALFLARVPRGYCLYDKSAMRRFMSAPGSASGNSMQNTAAARCGILGLARMIRNHVPHGFEYLNVGHSNIRWAVLRAIRRAGMSRMTFLIHDMIPLDFPEFTRPEVQRRFARSMRLAGRMSDRIIYNSYVTRKRAEHWFERWGSRPSGQVAPLGTDLPAAPAPDTEGKIPSGPYFVVLGTIEPRKNHAMLLDIWEEFGRDLPEHHIPHLHIVGHRGWLNDALFARLDRSPIMGATVHERGTLADEQVRGLLTGARALLFPTLAEGFGLPLAEALQLEIKTLCTDLPVFRELFGDLPGYLPANDRAAWSHAILGLAKAPDMAHDSRIKKTYPPLRTWTDHFEQVLGICIERGNGCGQWATDVEGSYSGVYFATRAQAAASSRDPQKP